jgi:hypothetical protein
MELPKFRKYNFSGRGFDDSPNGLAMDSFEASQRKQASSCSLHRGGMPEENYVSD